MRRRSFIGLLAGSTVAPLVSPKVGTVAPVAPSARPEDVHATWDGRVWRVFDKKGTVRIELGALSDPR